MKRLLFTITAVAALAASASIGQAAAKKDFYAAAARSLGSASGLAIANGATAQRSDVASPGRKTYAWPDQRYYGRQGMVSD